MKKMQILLAFLLFLVMLSASSGIASDTDILPRGKSIGMTKDDWINRYSSIPEKLVRGKTDVYLFLLTEENFRKYYYACPIDNVDFIVMCEDKTDEVVAVLIQVHLSELTDSYDAVNAVAQFFIESIYRMALATDQSISAQDIAVEILSAMDAKAIADGEEFYNSVNVNGFIYTITYHDGTLSYNVKNSAVYESEEAFLQDR